VRFKKEVLGMWKASAELQAKLRLETPVRPQDSGPILILPASDASVSWLPFSARATTLVGREVERAQLNAFLLSNQKVAWLLLGGAGGTGKSRLALELCRAIRPEWDAGFLSRTDRFRQWSHFRPSRPTLSPGFPYQVSQVSFTRFPRHQVSSEEGKPPIFCLLQDDRLISEIKVTADQLLLLPKETTVTANDVFLVVNVSVEAPPSNQWHQAFAWRMISRTIVRTGKNLRQGLLAQAAGPSHS
jgi:hypothetical protein